MICFLNNRGSCKLRRFLFKQGICLVILNVLFYINIQQKIIFSSKLEQI